MSMLSGIAKLFDPGVSITETPGSNNLAIPTGPLFSADGRRTVTNRMLLPSARKCL
jgi:hypothetical protein